MASCAYSLSKEDVIKLFHLAIQLYWPAILVLIAQMKEGNIDLRYIGAMTLTLTLVGVQKYIQGEMKKDEKKPA